MRCATCKASSIFSDTCLLTYIPIPHLAISFLKKIKLVLLFNFESLSSASQLKVLLVFRLEY